MAPDVTMACAVCLRDVGVTLMTHMRAALLCLSEAGKVQFVVAPVSEQACARDQNRHARSERSSRGLSASSELCALETGAQSLVISK